MWWSGWRCQKSLDMIKYEKRTNSVRNLYSIHLTFQKTIQKSFLHPQKNKREVAWPAYMDAGVGGKLRKGTFWPTKISGK